MPSFDDSTTARAPVEDVWKLLYDPSRFVEWWAGIETVEPAGHEGRGDITVFPAGYPDFPMPQRLQTDADGRRVTVSCLVSDLVFAWRLEPVADGTRIAVHAELPEAEAHRLEGQREVIATSLRALAELAGARLQPRRPGLEPLGVREGQALGGPGRHE
jgi:uncharacterized protein YndB with AHSA1/START domain